jgi:hypothetical protein
VTVTDAGLRDFKELPNLHKLVIVGRKTTGEGLKEIQEMKGLKTLVFFQGNVTAGALAELKKARPDLQIDTNTPVIDF